MPARCACHLPKSAQEHRHGLARDHDTQNEHDNRIGHRHDEFQDRTLKKHRREEAAANAIRFNNLVLMAASFPRTAEMLDKAGYEIAQIDNTDCAKLDGGMSCLSLRF